MLWQLFAATPSPAPSPNVDQDLVTPGVWGFAITALVMIAVILLIIDMVRRMRRLNYRAEIRQRLEGEAAAASITPPGAAPAAGSPSSGTGTR
ncbi:MAG TPA: hypothetical protein VGM70_06395 [Pseudolysinimonas sp.]